MTRSEILVSIATLFAACALCKYILFAVRADKHEHPLKATSCTLVHECECVPVGSAPEAVLFGEGAGRSLKWGGEWWVPDRGCDHAHDWSRTLNGSPVPGAECLDCGKVVE